MGRVCSFYLSGREVGGVWCDVLGWCEGRSLVGLLKR